MQYVRRSGWIKNHKFLQPETGLELLSEVSCGSWRERVSDTTSEAWGPNSSEMQGYQVPVMGHGYGYLWVQVQVRLSIPTSKPSTHGHGYQHL